MHISLPHSSAPINPTISAPLIAGGFFSETDLLAAPQDLALSGIGGQTAMAASLGGGGVGAPPPQPEVGGGGGGGYHGPPDSG